jgi:type IV pilus assembly protein PilC
MARFAFEARDATGVAVRGVEIALDEFDLDRRLAEGDLLLVRANRLARGRIKASSNRALVDFCYHLAVVLEAGIPLLEGLRDLSQSDHPMQDTIGDVARKIESGSSFSAALDDYPQVFPELVRGLVRAGEESGTLDRVLKDLVRFLEWREALRRQVSSAATYPALVIAGIIGLGVLLTSFVLPAFLDIFAELGATLPPTTRALLWSHEFIAQFWPYLLFSALGALAAGGAALRHTRVRLRFDRFVLRIPTFGNLTMMIEMSRFSHNLSILLASNIPMMRALEMVASIVQNRAVRQSIVRSRELVEQGGTLTDSLARSDLLPSLVLRMISVGESSGTLDDSLERVAEYYDREVPVIVSRTIMIFNTATLLLLGVVLVVVILSIFAPLYSVMGELNA